MTKQKAFHIQEKFDELAKKISSRVPKEAQKYTSERIIHKIRYGAFSN